MITQNDIDVMSDIERRVNLWKVRYYGHATQKTLLSSLDCLQNIGLYGGAGVTAAYGRFYRKPPWSVWRTFGYSTLASMVGLGASSIISIRVLFRGLDRLENKDRFNAALRAMKEDRNQNSKTGPYRPYQHQPAAERDDATVDDSSGASWAGASDAPVQAPEPTDSELGSSLLAGPQIPYLFQALVLCLKKARDGRTYERREARQGRARGMLFASGI